MDAGIWLYPWDLLDEGPRPVLERLARAGYSAVHLAASYHTLQAVLPHNPRRRTWLAERAALYFAPRPELWPDGALQPAISRLVVEQGDALALARPLARDLGLRLVAWTVCLHNSDLGARYPAVNVRNLYGEPYRHSLCAAQPAAQAYLLALVHDLRDRADVIELEAPHWLAFPHHQHAKVGVPYGDAARLALSLCFCEACTARGAAAGADVPRLQAQLRERLAVWLAQPAYPPVLDIVGAWPDLGQYLSARRATIAALIRDLAAAAAPTPVTVMPLGPSWLTGADSVTLAAAADRLEVLAYGPTATVQALTQAALAQVPANKLLVGLSLLASETPDQAAFDQAWAVVRAAGMQHVALYNYGLAAEARLGWLTEALSRENE